MYIFSVPLKSDMSWISHHVSLCMFSWDLPASSDVFQRPRPATRTTPGPRLEQDFTCSAQQRSRYVPADLRSKADGRT